MKLHKGLMSISDFAAYCGATRQTMQYYDRIGLLRPLQLGSQGYRYYHPLQGHEVRLIRSLQRSGCSLEEVNGILNSPDIDTMQSYIREKQQALQQEQQRIHREQVYLERFYHYLAWSERFPANTPTVFRSEHVLYLEETVRVDECGPFSDSYYAMLEQYAEYCKQNHAVQLYPYALYVSPEDRKKNLHFTKVFAFPEDMYQPSERSVAMQPGEYVCLRSYPESIADIRPGVYQAIREYLERNGCEAAGGSFEIPFCIPRGLRRDEHHFSVVFITPITRKGSEEGDHQ